MLSIQSCTEVGLIKNYISDFRLPFPTSCSYVTRAFSANRTRSPTTPVPPNIIIGFTVTTTEIDGIVLVFDSFYDGVFFSPLAVNHIRIE